MTDGARSSPVETVGVLGGTFDPVHLGHLHAAEWVRRVFSLPRILFVPCATPPHKSPSDLSTAEHRLAMLRLARGDREWLEVSTLELERGGISYTIDTLRALRATPPPCASLFILGTDALVEIPTWHRYEELIREFDLVAVDRAAGRLNDILGRLDPATARRLVRVSCKDGAGAEAGRSPPGTGGSIFHVSIPPLPVSSSEVRACATAGRPLDGLVPSSVARYIQEKGLYRQEDIR